MWRNVCLCFALVVVSACSEPYGPFAGEALRGEEANGPFADWRLADTVGTIELETDPDNPYSVTVWCVSQDEALYVASSLISGNNDPQQRRWVRNVVENPAVRVKIGDVVYPFQAMRVTDEDRFDEILDRFQAKYKDDFPEVDAHARMAWIFELLPSSS